MTVVISAVFIRLKGRLLVAIIFTVPDQSVRRTGVWINMSFRRASGPVVNASWVPDSSEAAFTLAIGDTLFVLQTTEGESEKRNPTSFAIVLKRNESDHNVFHRLGAGWFGQHEAFAEAREITSFSGSIRRGRPWLAKALSLRRVLLGRERVHALCGALPDKCAKSNAASRIASPAVDKTFWMQNIPEKVLGKQTWRFGKLRRFNECSQNKMDMLWR